MATNRKSTTIGATSFDVPEQGPFKKYVKKCGFYCWYDAQFIGSRSTPYAADQLLTDHSTRIARLEGYAQGYRAALADQATFERIAGHYYE